MAGSARRDLTSSGSPARRNPVSMKTGTSLSPKAFFATSVATVLSTPPETAAMALPVLIASASRGVSTARKLEGWNPWTATDNRSPLATWLGWRNLLFINRARPQGGEDFLVLEAPQIIGRGTWLDKVASEILDREKSIGRNAEILRVESGLGASGIPHIGNYSDAARAYGVKLALEAMGSR